MTNKFFVIILIFNFVGLYTLNQDISELKVQLTRLEIKKMTRQEIDLKTKVIAKEMKNKAKAVLSIRCQDSSIPPKVLPKIVDKSVPKETYPKKRHGTAAKVGNNFVVTVDHIISNSGDEKNRVLPITCSLYQRGKEVGSYDSRMNHYKQIGQKDISFIQVDFNEDGQEIEKLTPEIYRTLEIGETLVLITHPKNMINDYLITFGMVLNDDAEKILETSRKEYWKNAIITDMMAAPGSSGSPLMTLDGKFIGIHVGGDRDELNANYQVVFDTEFYLSYQMYKLFNEKKINKEKTKGEK